MSAKIEIAGTEIETGDLIKLPISRTETVSHLAVIGVDDDRVYLRKDGNRFTLHTDGAIAFAVLEGDSIEPTEILAVETIERGDGSEMPSLDEIEIAEADE